MAEDLGRLKGYIEHFGVLDDDPLLAELELDGGGVLADTALALRGLAG